MSATVTTNEKDGSRTYIYPPTGEAFVSVTTVTGGTEDSGFFIGPWKAKLAAQVAVERADELAAVREQHGPVVAKDARYGNWLGAASAVKAITARVEELAAIKADAGKHVHAVTEALVLWAASPDGDGGDITIPDLPEHLVGALYDDEPIEIVIDAMVNGFCNFVADFKPRFTSTEMVVFDPTLRIAGTLDARIELDGLNVDSDGHLYPLPKHVLSVTVDTKSGRHMKWTWSEQVERYRLMPVALVANDELVDIEPTQASAVLHLRPNFPRGYQLRFLSAEDRVNARNSFRHALHVYTTRQSASSIVGPVARPLAATGELAPVFLGDLAGEVHGRVLNPLLAAFGADATVDDVARFTEQELLAIKYIGPAAVKAIADTVRVYASTTHLQAVA